MTDLFDEPDAATPLEAEEKECLKQSWITTRADLNDAEQQNIAKAAQWAFSQRRSNILDETFIRKLHKKMLADVWTWAGSYRKTARNLGIDAYRIPIEIQSMLSDVNFWIENQVYPVSEIAVRLHHRLVVIHPFPNGNGRHARLMGDLLADELDEEPFSWGREHLHDTTEAREKYISALRAADNHDIRPLIKFARS